MATEWSFLQEFELLQLFDSPDEVARKFFKALEDGDEQTAKSYANPKCQEALSMMMEMSEFSPRYTVYGQPEITGNHAKIRYVVSSDSGTMRTLPLDKENGRWKVKCDKSDLIEAL